MYPTKAHISPFGILKQAKWICLLAFFVCSCKKDNLDHTVSDEIISPATGTRKELTLDSIFLYARQLYIWNEGLPSYADFAPRDKYIAINPDRTAYERALYDLSQYQRRAEGTAYEWSGTTGKAKYSYLDNYSGSASGRTAESGNTSPETAVTYWTIAENNIAYLYIASFPDLPEIRAQLEAVVAELQQKNISHLILDIRHNGGGHVHSVEHLANLIAPRSLEGKVMFSEQFNSRVQQGNATILQFQPYLDENGKTVPYKGRMASMADVDYSEKANTTYFSKKGAWNGLQQLSFLVSKRTASAAELLISIFKPYIRTRVIGEQTYGKPVGFFPVRIDQYNLYLASFVLRNSAGWSDYYDGIPVDIAVQAAGSYPNGDSNDPLLAAALQDISPSQKSQTVHKTATVTQTKAERQTDYFVPIRKERFQLKKQQ